MKATLEGSSAVHPGTDRWSFVSDMLEPFIAICGVVDILIAAGILIQ